MEVAQENQSSESTESKKSSSEDRYAKLRLRLRTDTKFFFENVLKIVDKNSELVDFKANEQQQILINLTRALVECQLPVRVIILKARQMGFSTAVEGLAFQEASMNPYRRVKIVAHKDDSTANLFEMSRLFHREMHPSLKPMTRYSSKTELDFQNPKDEHSNPGLRSYIRVSTAGGKGVGRSDTLQFLHLSEVAFWENAASISNALTQAVPIVPGTKVYLESTANGIGGHFHDQYWKHKAGKEQLLENIRKDWRDVDKLKNHLMNFRGNLGYIPLFFPWHEFPEYQIKVTDSELDWLRSSLSPEEKEIMSEYNLTLEQIKWRRWKIEELSEDSEGTHPEDIFKQEYPSSDREAFISRGSNMFSQTALDKMPKESPIARWNLVDGETKFEYGDPFVPPAHEEDPYGEFSIFRKPETGRQYIVSCDVAEGVGQDSSVMEVLDKRTLEQCAEYVSDRVSPDVFGRLAVQVASWYNEAQLAIEWNSAGQASIIAVRDTLYPNIYFRESNYDKIQDEPTEMWGFKTTSATKPMILWEMEKHIRQRTVVFHSEGLIQECREFTVEKSPTGSTVRLSAPEGKHDDRVMAMAIGLQVYREYPHEWKEMSGAKLYDTQELESMEQQEYADDELYGDL